MVAALLAAAVISGSVQDSPKEALKSALDALGQKHFSGLLYIEKAGKELFFHTVGFADPETKRPFTKQTGVDIGSLVKPIVKTAILKLEAEGKLSTSDTIDKYFEGVPGDKKEITIQQLMDHKAGFRGGFGRDYQPMERDELMGKMLASELRHEPGTREMYSNAGYSMLAAIIEKVTGEALENHIARTQFKPLGIRRFGYVLPKWKPEETTIGYSHMLGPQGKRWGSPIEQFWHEDGPSWNLRGNGGMITTVPELVRWYDASHNGELLTKEAYAKYAPIFARGEAPRNSMLLDVGGNAVFNTVMAFAPGMRVYVVAVSTDGRLMIEREMRGLLKLIMPIIRDKQT